MAFPSLGAEVEFWSGETSPEPGIIEALNGTVADIRISSDQRLEETVDMETSGYHPLRGYRKLSS